VLVFHRGITVAEDSGLYVNEKIDLLVDYLVVWPFNKARPWLGAKASKLAVKLKLKKAAAAQEGEGARGLKPKLGGSMAASRSAFGTAAAAPVGASASGDAPGGGIDGQGDDEAFKSHKAAKVVERRSLKRLMPTTWSIIKSLPRTLKLQEPMFKEVGGPPDGRCSTSAAIDQQAVVWLHVPLPGVR
jgi:hypothetical protein